MLPFDLADELAKVFQAYDAAEKNNPVDASSFKDCLNLNTDLFSGN